MLFWVVTAASQIALASGFAEPQAAGFTTAAAPPPSFTETPASTFTPAPAPEWRETNDRGAKARKAAEALLDLQFMSEGRGMIAPPGLPPYPLNTAVGRATVHNLKPILENQFGLIVENDQIVGYHDGQYKNHNVAVVGCAMCHAGRAAGRFIPGLGNKTIDIFQLARAAQTLMPVMPYWPDSVNQELHQNAEHFVNEIGNPRLATKTQGLIPIAIIRKWFFDQAGEKMDNEIPGSVKIPALWSYGEKRKMGSFSDGFGKGTLPGWAIAVELVAGQTPNNVHRYQSHIEAAEGALADLLPPPYPFAIDAVKAQAGQKLFVRTCSRCHGTYERDDQGYPIFKQPLFVQYNAIRTDSARLDGVTPRFYELVKTNPLNDIVQATANGRGYIAQRLNGIWARFPYLHNGSVPTVYALINPDARPRLFSLRRAGDLERFDAKNLGLGQDPRKSPEQIDAASAKGARWVYNTTLYEHANVGHDFESLRDLSDPERYEIIEYLKTL